MPLLKHRYPSYRHHKGTGQAVVTLNNRDIYLGVFGTPESRNEYDRVIQEWLARGKNTAAAPGGSDLTVVELIDAFMTHADGYYRRPDGTPTSEVGNFKDALRPLNRLYGHATATSFGPLALKAVRAEMIRLGWCRGTVNKNVRRIRAVFRWAGENELLPASVYHGLSTVAGLKQGRSEAPETDPVKPVPDGFLDAVLPFVSGQVRAMIELQLLTGMRPGEVCAMRGIDVGTGGALWTYTPAQHKTLHHGHARVVTLGPKAQAIIKPFLKPDTTAYLFSPADAEASRRAILRENRTTPASCGNGCGDNRKVDPKRTPGLRFNVEAYCHCIHQACDKAFPAPPHLARVKAAGSGRKKARWESRAEWLGRLGDEGRAQLDRWRATHRWHPNQLRHTAATELRKRFGLEAAQCILGHRTLTVTQIYAEKNVEAAALIMAQIG